MDYKLKSQQLMDTIRELRIEINNLKQINQDHQRINGRLRIRLNEMVVKGKSKFKFEIPVQSGDEATKEIVKVVTESLEQYVQTKNLNKLHEGINEWSRLHEEDTNGKT